MYECYVEYPEVRTTNIEGKEVSLLVAAILLTRFQSAVSYTHLTLPTTPYV